MRRDYLLAAAQTLETSLSRLAESRTATDTLSASAL
jgi:hypothetical protein